MGTEVWFRNPHNYIRELSEARGKFVCWDRGMLTKRRIDPYKHAELYFGQHAISDWRILLVGTQGSAELRPGFLADNPYAVYPTWSGDEDMELLEEMMAHPLGEDTEACSDMSCTVDERPVIGQEHRVIVTDIPPAHSGVGRSFISKLKDLQEEYPSCILHIHGLYSWRVSFGMGFGASDVDPRMSASKGRVILPSGKEMIAERTIGCPQWVDMLGMRVVDLKIPANRCIYNVKSALWAGEHYMENIKFKSAGSTPVNPDTKNHKPAQTQSHMSLPIVAKKGDKQICDTCSLQNTCKFYRQGAVCSVPGTDNAELANIFMTRDADSIIGGLGTILATQTRRMEKGVREEEDYGELNPEVTKIMNQIFQNGKQLAQLIDPNLRGGARIQINNGVNPMQGATQGQVLGSILAQFEARGIPRNEVTPEMLKAALAELGGGPPAPQQPQIPQVVESQVLGRQ